MARQILAVTKQSIFDSKILVNTFYRNFLRQVNGIS
jgi:hypothetical protein